MAQAHNPANHPSHHFWHTHSAEEVLGIVKSAQEGLSKTEAAHRLQIFGPNILPQAKPPGVFQIYLHQFASPLIFVLLAAAVVSLLIDEYTDAVFIFLVLQINAALGTFQEWRARASAEKLTSLIQSQTIVLRGGKKIRIPSTELVVGDVIKVFPGSNIPADVRLLNEDDLSVDESHLTGESMPVRKATNEIYLENAPLPDRGNMLHAGSIINTGRATGVTVFTGIDSAIGKIAKELATAQTTKTPLEVRLHKFTRIIGLLVVGVITLLGFAQIAQGVELSAIFQVSVALAVSAIPEGLPVAITVALSVGSARMARREVIVTKLFAVEGLGACTLIASDKTGTLTCNTLTVKTIILPGGSKFNVSGDGYQPDGGFSDTSNNNPDDADILALRKLARVGALSNDGGFEKHGNEWKFFGDTTDVAFLVLAEKLGISKANVEKKYPEISTLPFDSTRQLSLSINHYGPSLIANVKGAVERVLPLCRQDEIEGVLETAIALAANGYRVLAVAHGEVSQKFADNPKIEEIPQLHFLGLVGIIDPPRPEVPEAMLNCKSAGVDVRMVTGDHPETALAIGHQLGLVANREDIIIGSELAELEEGSEQFIDRVLGARIFARVDPMQKLAIVRALEQSGHFVAVTGDGVNDAPALKASHIGVAMGRDGTDVARSAANLILADDNFASIVAGIEEGRIAFDNVRKVVYLLISTGAAEIILFLLAFFSGLPLPLFAVQLLWLNLVTNGIQDVALAFEKGEPGILTRSPRPPTQPIFDRQMTSQTIVSGLFIGIAAFLFYRYQLNQGIDEAYVRNELLLLMVLFENVHVFNCRSEKRSAFVVPFSANPLLIWAVIASQLVHIVSMHIPIMGEVLGIAPVSFADWISVAMLAMGVLGAMEVYKYVYSRFFGQKPT